MAGRPIALRRGVEGWTDVGLNRFASVVTSVGVRTVNFLLLFREAWTEQAKGCAMTWEYKVVQARSSAREWRSSLLQLGSRSPIGHRFGESLVRLVYCQQNRGLGARHSAGARGGTERGRTAMIRHIHN